MGLCCCKRDNQDDDRLLNGVPRETMMELEGMKLSVLKKRAAEVGADARALEEADDAETKEDTKAIVIALIIEQEAIKGQAAETNHLGMQRLSGRRSGRDTVVRTSWDDPLQGNKYEVDTMPLNLQTQSVIVVSCPEMGSLQANNNPPYDQHVMDFLSELQARGLVTVGFDRAG